MKKGYLIFLVVFISACRTYNPSVMFQVPKGYPIAQDSVSNKVIEYKISEYDQLDMHIFTNDGFKLVDVTGATSFSGGGGGLTHYNVENDGQAKLPLLGKTFLKGLTIREAERFLEEKYSLYYKSPFVMMDVVNRRVIIFKGDGGAADVLEIHNENISLIEAIARSGGISANGKAYKIKLIRGSMSNPEIHLIDLSTIEGAKKGNLSLQANDIIYVEPVRNIDQKVLIQLSTIIGILTSVFLIYDISRGK